MDVLNMNSFPVSARVKDAAGTLDYVTVAPKRRVTLPPHLIVDNNWLADQTGVKAFESSSERIAMVLPQTTVLKVLTPAFEPAATVTSAESGASADSQVKAD